MEINVGLYLFFLLYKRELPKFCDYCCYDLCRGLDLTKWIINDEHQPAIYDLLAVTNHIGKIGGGHCEYWNAFSGSGRLQLLFLHLSTYATLSVNC